MVSRVATVLAVVGLLLYGAFVPTSAGDDETRLEARLIAPATAGDISGKAEFREKEGRRQFSVQVEGLAPGDMYDVMIATVFVGTVEIDDFGIGELDYDDNFEPGVDDPATRFPADFPALDGGENVEVGLLKGTLQSK